MKKLLLITLLFSSLCLDAMQVSSQPELGSGSSVLAGARATGGLIQAQMERNREAERANALQDFIDYGSPDDLDNGLMELSLRCAPKNLRDMIKGYQDEQTRSLYSNVWTFLGVPGTGKTTAALAVAHALRRNYSLIEAGMLANEYQNSGAQNLWRAILPLLDREGSDVIILDEYDALSSKSNRDEGDGFGMSIAFQKLIDRVQKLRGRKLLLLLGNSNKMSCAMKSRLVKGTVQFGLPVEESRIYITESLHAAIMLNVAVDFKGQSDRSYFIEKTDGLSIRDLEGIFDFAVRESLENQGTESKKITRANIDEAFDLWHYVAYEVLEVDEDPPSEHERLHAEQMAAQEKHHQEALREQEAKHQASLEQQRRLHEESAEQQRRQQEQSIAEQRRLQEQAQEQQRRLHEESAAQQKRQHEQNMAEQQRLQEQNQAMQQELAAQQQALQLVQACRSEPKKAVPDVVKALNARGTPQARAVLSIAEKSGAPAVMRASKKAQRIEKFMEQTAAYHRAKAERKAAKKEKKAAKKEKKAATKAAKKH